jgi:glycosyltransferase 2 family protein
MSKKWLLIAVKVVLSVALIVWVFKAKDIDFAAAAMRVTDMSPLLAIPAALAVLFQYGICSVRWRAVLAAVGAPLAFWPGLRFMYIGAFFHQTLPASVGGDAVRTYLAYRHGVSLRGAINGIMLERVVTLAALILLVAAVQPVFLPRVGSENGAWMIPLVGLAVAGMIGGILVVAMLDRLPQRYHRYRLVRGLAYLATDTRALFFSPKRAFAALGWAMIAHSALTVGIFLIARGLSVDIGIIDCFGLFLPVLLLTALPISVAGWGVREGGMVFAFGLIGVPGDAALAISVLYGLFTLFMALPAGVLWLSMGIKRGDVTGGLTQANSSGDGDEPS